MKQPTVPSGLKDILPKEERELSKIKEITKKAFKSWGYLSIKTPAFEYYDLLTAQTGDFITGEVFKFFDSDGALLALRPEMTTPIARLVAQRYSQGPTPIRLSYVADVFRQEKPRQGQQRQFLQAGIELIGSSSGFSDAETIIILIETLKKVGLRDFRVGIGQIDFVNGLIEQLTKDVEVAKEIRKLIARKNLVGLSVFLKRMKASKKSKDALLKAITLNGKYVLTQAKELAGNIKSQAALNNLIKIKSLIQSYGYLENVVFDLSIVRDFDYYTGVVFEAYSPQVGLPIAGGGRYDGLLKTFGVDMPSAGFAIGLERLHIALAGQKVKISTKDKSSVRVGMSSKALLEDILKLRRAK
ncbi:MAG: ATP phosphoribosyltransferase regulatory subunit [Actinobacteria bacterium]|nr:MAG: ATP phosphoribosyltransferase regulatory subunit [Actinomycetota bacterium]